MAKLSARGRTEVARWSKENEVTDPNRTTSWERTEYTLMSDGTLLRKFTARFREGNKLHNYGWTVVAKKKTLEVVEAAMVRAGCTRA